MVDDKISNPFAILLVLLGYLVLWYIYKPTISPYKSISATRERYGLLLIMIICLFSVQDTDYYHYQTALRAISKGAILHFEDVYYTIGEIVSYNYFLFRFVVWGSAFALFCWSAKRLKVPLPVVMFFFVTMYLTKFSYARASLAMSIGFFGYTFIIKPIRLTLISYILGISTIIISLYFHKSAVFMIPVYVLSSFKLNKYSLGIALILFPFGYYFISEFGISLLMNIDDTENSTIISAQGYLMRDASNKGIAVIILHFLERTPYYIIVYLIYKIIRNKNYDMLNYSQRSICNVVLYVVAFASLFLFDYSINTSVLYYRFLYYSILPLSMILPILLKLERNSRLFKIAYTMGFYSVIYSILYSFYNAYLSA